MLPLMGTTVSLAVKEPGKIVSAAEIESVEKLSTYSQRISDKGCSLNLRIFADATRRDALRQSDSHNDANGIEPGRIGRGPSSHGSFASLGNRFRFVSILAKICDMAALEHRDRRYTV